MSRFYARFKETKEEIFVFPTQQQCDDWVNFQDEFSLFFNNTAETAMFQRVSLTERQANNIIKTLSLTEITEEDLIGNNVTLFRKVRLI